MEKHRGPGKANREGISILELSTLFPDEDTAAAWFEALVWPDGRQCPRCGCTDTRETAATAGLPYHCRGCGKGFSVRIGTALERSKVPLRKWVFAIYLEMTSLKGVSSMKLHRDIGVTQKTAWFMLHRIREAWGEEQQEAFSGPVEADEAYFGGLRANMHKDRRRELTGRGTVGKTAVAGMKDRNTNRVAAQVVPATDGETLQAFVRDHAEAEAVVYTDEHRAYAGLSPDYNHEAVQHSVGEYVRGQAHTQGIESFWSMLKRAHKGVYHKLSPKHLDRYVREFAGRHNVRGLDTLDQMATVAVGLVGKRLMYRQLIADNGLDSGARS
ncbi:MAG: IS1595 family transposase [Caldilineaceae bacterium SB0662_bin_9]|uniref:IS1595 family transposase n=1 Tax=Caldilineaceae bacterium SB0662_bin_9 TaxID=2605258 RepID=A0A6B1DXG8_9CHLR|nr:IS1595 family transposase [Caldilineaceae bacterium SB0662_bin_9]